MKRELYWIANYIGGTKLQQYENGKENRYSDIDRERLERFDLIDYSTNKPVYSLFLQEGQQLIYRRRTLKPVVPSEKRPEQVIYLVGFQYQTLTLGGPRTTIVINYLYQDGSVALDGPRNNLELYPIEL